MGDFMRKVTLTLLTAAGVALGAQAASAADMSRPVYKAPPPAVVAAYNWSGFYIGGHIGYGWSSEEATDVLTAVSGAPDPDGFLGGVQAGYNWQVDRWVFGIEGDWSWTGASGSAAPFGTFFVNSDHSWYATLTGRLGYAWDSWMWYVKGGAAWADAEYSVAGFGSLSDTRVGWTIGTGVEWAIAPNWSAKLEYNYLDFGKDTYNIVNWGPVDVDSQVHLVKLGLNYRFGDYGKAPVAARY
jgi:outer membrane immunogenic protein